MRRFFIFRRISSKFYFCQIFYHAKLLPHYYAKLLPHYYAKLLPHYHTKSLKSNFLTTKSYSAPATVKFYTVSNFGRANKLQLISCKQAGKLESWKAPNFRKEKLELHFLKPIFLTYKI